MSTYEERVAVRLRFYDLNLDFEALRETLDRMAKELSQLGKGANRSTDLLRYWAARDNNSSYWRDARGNYLLMPGMKPILSHGKRSRR